MPAPLRLATNLIGKLLGRDHIALLGSQITIQTSYSTLTTAPLSSSYQFAELKEGLLGSTLLFSDGGKKFHIRWLKSAGGRELVHALNQAIAGPLYAYLDETFAQFKALAVREYPRDSRLATLATLCQTLAERYAVQPALWEQHLEPDYIESIKTIVGQHPLQAANIQHFHEQLQLTNRHAFFERVEAHPLTHEQRLATLRNNDKNMVLAAAGTGKTSVMVAKTLDLLDRGLAQADEILVLAYNTKAANELKQRLQEKAQQAGIALSQLPRVATFHALGRQLLTDSGNKVTLSHFTANPSALKGWVLQWLEDYLATDSQRVMELMRLTPAPVNPFDFTNRADYERCLRDSHFCTLSGETVATYQHLVIANFMFLNNIEYRYRPAYISQRQLGGATYRPDFQLLEQAIYLDHLTLDRQQQTPVGVDAAHYLATATAAYQLHQECHTQLIETFHYEWSEDRLLPELADKLAAIGIECQPISSEKLLYTLRREGLFERWSEQLLQALQAIRSEQLDKSAIKARFKRGKLAQSESLPALLESLHRGYIAALEQEQAIDFDDMISKPTALIRQGAYTPQWRYILVDEFQDISAARMSLLEALIDHGPSPSLTVVGDDWQSIYRFSGGKLELTTRFNEQVGSHSFTKLQKTFRYNSSIAYTAGRFIMQNPEQIEKQIESHTQVTQSQIYLLDDKGQGNQGLNQRIESVIETIRERKPRASIAIIARYNYLLEQAKNALSPSLQQQTYFWSYHKAKGLEADYVILIGLTQGKNGFPSQNTNNATVEALLPTSDSYPHSEERRLLYVGLTRAKHKCYLIADPQAPSAFVRELLHPDYGVTLASNSFNAQHQQRFKCPHCSDGFFRLVTGPHGSFYRCSSEQGCPVGTAKACERCGAPATVQEQHRTCHNKECAHQVKLCKRCGRVMTKRQSDFGEFWGCSGYGLADDPCAYTCPT